MFIIGNISVVPLHRILWVVTQSRKAGHLQSDWPTECLKQISFAVALERHPSVAFTISPGSSYYKSAGIIHLQQLPPAPQRKVLAISFFAFFESFRRLPVSFLTKLLLVRYVTAVGKKPPHFGEVRTPMLQGLTEKPTCREGGPKPAMSPRIRTENFPALDVVKLRKHFRNQIIHQFSGDVTIRWMHVIETTLDVISSDQIVKAIPSRNEDTDVAELCSMALRLGKALPATIARTEDIVCSGIPSPPI
jgi:hypothetical protein